jgi:hypothetical protein
MILVCKIDYFNIRLDINFFKFHRKSGSTFFIFSSLVNKKKYSIFVLEKKKKGTTMETNQIKLLKNLAKKIKAEQSSKEDALKTLQSAKILDKKGNFTKNYSNLRRVFI